MKYRIILLFFLASAAGCADKVVDPVYHYDAVERALESPFGEVAIDGFALENGQNFDAAVALFRMQGDSGGFWSSIGRVAFERNGIPAQADSAIINGIALPWNSAPPGSDYGMEYTYASMDSSLNGAPDSLRFGYKGFGEESFEQSAAAVPSFGTFTFPDTISASQGSRITYQNSIPNDTIFISVSGGDTVFSSTRPDTGSIVFAPHQLPPPLLGGFWITCYRWNWTTRMSPSGKRIGIYTLVIEDNRFIRAKP